MAATASRTNIVRMHGGMTGRVMEYGTITYDSDATVEVPTTLNQVENWSFAEAVSGGSADLPSLDETFSNGRVDVPSTKTLTVDTGANSTRTFTYQLIGY